jgi:transmembrane sensor
MPVLRIAASLLVGIGLSVFLWNITRNRKIPVEYITIKTGTNDIKQVTLPDSSVVWVNSASVLQVPATFQGHQREVKLLEGEAFFDVKHDKVHPFVVHVKQLNVQVLGTSFNVQAYKGLNSIGVAVATGKVGVTRDGKTLQMLLPDNLLTYNSQTGAYFKKHIDASQIQAWRSGNSYLNQAGFNELALMVKNIFGITLKAGSSKVNAYRFTLSIKHNITSQQVLKIISQIHNTQYRKEGDSVILY